MKMKKSIKVKTNIALFLLMLTMACTWNKGYTIYQQTMRLFLIFDQMIIPGMFFYWQFRERFLKEDLNVVKLVIDKRREEAKSSRQSQYFLQDGGKSSS